MVADSLTKILIAGGAIGVTVGTYLPWVKVNPNLSTEAEIPALYSTGMSAGLEGFDFALLGAVGLVVLLPGVSVRPVVRTAVVLGVGIGTAVFPVYYLSSSSLFGFSATFTPALGWYLTVLGGILLSVAGGLQLPSVIRRPTATVSRRE